MVTLYVFIIIYDFDSSYPIVGCFLCVCLRFTCIVFPVGLWYFCWIFSVGFFCSNQRLTVFPLEFKYLIHLRRLFSIAFSFSLTISVTCSFVSAWLNYGSFLVACLVSSFSGIVSFCLKIISIFCAIIFTCFPYFRWRYL